MATGINFDDEHRYNHPDNPIVATVGCIECGGGCRRNLRCPQWPPASSAPTTVGRRGRRNNRSRAMPGMSICPSAKWQRGGCGGPSLQRVFPPSRVAQVLLPEIPAPPIAWRRLPSDTSRSIRLVRRIRTVFCGGTAMVLGLGKPNRPGAIYVMDKLAGVFHYVIPE